MAELSQRAAYSSGGRLRDAFLYFPLVLGGLILLALFVVVLFGPFLAPYNPYLVDRVVIPHYDFDTGVYIRPPLTPTEGFPLGTDENGMDILSLLLYGARNTMIAGVLVAAARVLLGLAIGLLAGWNEGKWFDRIVMGAIGLLSSLPVLISGMILIFALGIDKGMPTFFVALSLVGWTEVAQYIRSEVLVLRTMPFMEGARVVGMGDAQLLVRQIIPNILPQLFIITFLEIGAVLMLLGELALLGVFIGGAGTLDFTELMGPQNIVSIPTQPEWGAMIASGFRWFRSFPHVVVMPAAAIFFSVLGFNLTGEGLRAMFERRGLSTGALLSKRTLLVIGILLAAMFYVFNTTHPSRWFGEFSATFNGKHVVTDAQMLDILGGMPGGADGGPPQAYYTTEQFAATGIRGGVKWSELVYRRDGEVFDLVGTPHFVLTGADEEEFQYGEDYVFMVGPQGGAGQAAGALVAVFLNNATDGEIGSVLADTDFQGKIVMLGESNAPASLSAALIQHGAAGILWVADEGQALEASRLRKIGQNQDPAEARTAPMLRISAESARTILKRANFDYPNIYGEINAHIKRRDPAAIVVPLSVQAKLEVDLREVGQVNLTSLIAYHPGTDADLGDEIVVLVAPCDGWWYSEQDLSAYADRSLGKCAAPYLLELTRLWESGTLDSRRPVMFIAWGGGEFGDFELSDWLTSEASFDYLTSPGLRLSPAPSIVIQVLDDAHDGASIGYSTSSDPDVLAVLKQGARRQNLAMEPVQQPLGMELIHSQAWAPYNMTIDLGATLDGANVQKKGEALTFMLVRMARESILNTD